MDTDAGVHVIFPNRKLTETSITNHTKLEAHPRTVLYHVTISNKNGSLVDMRKQLEEHLYSHPYVLRRPPVTVSVGMIDGCGTALEIRASIKASDFPNSNNLSVVADILTSIREKLVDLGIQFGHCSIRRSS